MTLLVFTALILIGFSALLVARAVTAPRARAAERIAQIDAYGYADPTAAPSAERRGLVASLGSLIAARMSREQLADTRTRLLGSGLFGTTAETYLGYRALSAVGIPALCLYVAVAGGLAPGLAVVFLMLGAFAGWTIPQAVVARRGRLRQDQIEREMPELVDLLVVGVESGMGFAGAMRAASAHIEGPLGDELKLMLREQSLGASMGDALRHMLARCDTPATRSFVRTITQGERLGVSIGTMMRSLAEEMRKRRKARAEELAHRAPIKLMFPLVFLIFPAMFIVLLGPAAINITQTLGN